MKRLIIFICMLVSVTVYAKPEPLDKVAAIVNDQVITHSELLNQVDIVRKQLMFSKTPIPEEVTLQKQVLQHLIDVDLQLQAAKRVGIEVDEAKLNDALRDIAKKNNVTLAQLREQVEQQGISYQDYRTGIQKQMIMSQLQQQAIGSSITISDDQVARYIKMSQVEKTVPREFHLQNILIPLPESPSPQAVAEAKKIADKVLRQIKQGEDFSQAAVSHSAGNTALQGGDLGWRQLAALPEVFAKPVANMKVGEISGPHQTPNGFHIIKLVAVRSDKVTPPNHQQAQQMLYAQRFEQAVQNWVQNLRSKAFIKIS